MNCTVWKRPFNWIFRLTGCMVRPLKMTLLLLSVHPLLHQCLLHLHLLPWLTFLCTCPTPSWRLFSSIEQNISTCNLSKGWRGACAPPPASFPGNQWANLMSVPPVTGVPHLHPAPGAKVAATSCLPSAPHGVASLQDLASDGWAPPTHPWNHGCLCRWLRALSSVSRLGKYRACRPAGCSPAIGGAARRRRQVPRAPRCREVRAGVGRWGASANTWGLKVAGQIPGWPSLVCGAPWWLSLRSGDPRESAENSRTALRLWWRCWPPLQWENEVRPWGGGRSCGLAVAFRIKKGHRRWANSRGGG